MVKRTPLPGRPPGRLLLTLSVRMFGMVLLWYGNPSWVRRRKLVLPYYTIRLMPVVPALPSAWTTTASTEFACLAKGMHTLGDWCFFDRHLNSGPCCCRLLLPLVFLRHRRRAEPSASCGPTLAKQVHRK